MKKILMLFLLAFPLLIFALVLWSSSVISYYLPLPVTSIETIEGRDIETNDPESSHTLKFQIYPLKARNQSFTIYDDEGNMLSRYDASTMDLPLFYTYQDGLVNLSLPNTGSFLKDGLGHLIVNVKNFGFTQLNIVTDDGKFSSTSDILIYNEADEQTDIQGIILSYQMRHQDYVFGSLNDIMVDYTFFPKRAYRYQTEEEALQLNETLRKNAEQLIFNLTAGDINSNTASMSHQGKATLKILLPQGKQTLSSTLLRKNASFTFDVLEGYNIHDEAELRSSMNQGKPLYLLNEIKITDWVVFQSQQIEGNDQRIDLSTLPYYDEVTENNQIKYVNRAALHFKGDHTAINRVRVVGPLKKVSQGGNDNDKGLPYENIINVLLEPDNHDTASSIIKNSIIENGRFNLSLLGKSRLINGRDERASEFIIDNVSLVGAAMASLEIDNGFEGASDVVSSKVFVTGLHISYTGIGIILQNGDGKGHAELYLKDDGEQKSITSTSWRNIDDATGALSANNFGYIIAELKKYTDVIFQDGPDSYVNPVIMIRGGRPNESIIDFSETTLFHDDPINSDLIKKTRKPNLIEAVHPSIGGTAPFTIYLLNPKLHPNYTKKEGA